MEISALCLIAVLLPTFFSPVRAHDFENTITENAVFKKRPDGKPIVVRPLITGAVGLFRQAYEREEVDVAGQMIIITRFRYFIGGDHIEQITPENYRELVKKYLRDAPELHRKLGRFGFRFANVPSMILYYNRFKSDVPMAMKYDLQKTSALFMEE